MISVALIGCGNIAVGYDAIAYTNERVNCDGARTHLRALLQAGDFKVTACIDPNPAALQKVRLFTEDFAPYSSVEDFIAAPTPFDIAVISSPTELHAKHIVFAIQQGAKAIFCEKPICSDPTTTKKLLELAKNKGIKVGVNYLRLWDSKLIELANLIQNNLFGELQSGFGYFSKGLVHNGPHMTVLLADLLGHIEPQEAETRIISQASSGEFATLSHKSALIVLNGLDHAHYDTFELELCFEKAIIRLEDGARRINIRYPCTHPKYRNLIYPEKLESYSSCQEMAMPQAWREWKTYFLEGTEMRRDAHWCAHQEEIAMVLAAWQNKKSL